MKRLLFILGLGVFALALQSLLRRRARQRKFSPPTGPDAFPSYDEIALRAYFIGLDREARGEPSAPQQDWTDAEHQLTAQTQCAAPASANALTRW
jgi:hypothetical protein